MQAMQIIDDRDIRRAITTGRQDTFGTRACKDVLCASELRKDRVPAADATTIEVAVGQWHLDEWRVVPTDLRRRRSTSREVRMPAGSLPLRVGQTDVESHGFALPSDLHG